jgi:hypothetical protein
VTKLIEIGTDGKVTFHDGLTVYSLRSTVCGRTCRR